MKIVVTNDRRRYLFPDFPKANYSVWVRGYGLVDSPKAKATPGQSLSLTAVVAPNARAAAEYYPAGYWLSLMSVPPQSEFPGTGPLGNGINPNVRHQAQWLRSIKSGGCTACHPAAWKGKGLWATISTRTPFHMEGGAGTTSKVFKFQSVRIRWPSDRAMNHGLDVPAGAALAGEVRETTENSQRWARLSRSKRSHRDLPCRGDRG